MKRRRFTRKSFRRRRPNKRARGLNTRVKRVLRVAQQQKWINSSQVSTAIGAPVANQLLINLYSPAPGSTRSNRIGNQMIIKEIRLRFVVTGGQAISTPAKVRWIIFVEKEPMNVALTPTLLNAGPSSPSGMFSNPDTTGSYSWISLLSPETCGPRYRILRDFTTTMNVTSSVAASNTDQNVYRKKTIRFKGGLKVIFNELSSAGNPLQINKNCVWVYACCDQAFASGPNVEFEALTKFSDM